MLYDAMSVVISAMLAAARDQDWDGLITLETECAAKVAALQREEPLLTSLQSERNDKRKAALITQMLVDDSEIRRLATAHMTRLSNQMHSTSTERKLSRAYGT